MSQRRLVWNKEKSRASRPESSQNKLFYMMFHADLQLPLPLGQRRRAACMHVEITPNPSGGNTLVINI